MPRWRGRRREPAATVDNLVRGKLAGILTVGEVDRFSDQGRMINFVIVDNRLRFEIRVDATERSRLKVSSRVMTLAETLHGTSK